MYEWAECSQTISIEGISPQKRELLEKEIRYWEERINKEIEELLFKNLREGE